MGGLRGPHRWVQLSKASVGLGPCIVCLMLDVMPLLPYLYAVVNLVDDGIVVHVFVAQIPNCVGLIRRGRGWGVRSDIVSRVQTKNTTR